MSVTTIESPRKRLYLVNRVKWLAILTFLLATSFIGYSQPITPNAELDYTIEEFNLPGGRLGNNVNSIVQGPYGFLWFGSHGGLHRYDGYEFVTFKTVPGDTIGETTSLTNPYVENLYWDSNDMLWVSSYGGGLYMFDPTTEIFKHYQHNSEDSTSISHPRVLAGIEDAQGQLWFGTEHGLNRFDRKTGKFKRYYADPKVPGSLFNDDVRSFYVDKQGVLWLGSGFVLWGNSNGALSRYNPESDSFTNYHFNPDGNSSVRGMLEDSNGNFWIGAENGLFKMDRQAETFMYMENMPNQPFAPGTKSRSLPAVYSILEDQSGGLWIGTIGEANYANHLLRYDTVTKKIQVFPVQSEAWQAYQSKDGTVWIAGAGSSGRALKIKPRTKIYDLSSDFSFQAAFSQSALSKKLKMNVVIGSAGMTIDSTNNRYWFQLAVGNTAFSDMVPVLAEYNPETNTAIFHQLPEVKIEHSNQFNQSGVNGFFFDKHGTIWGSYFNGIFNYDPKTRNVEQYQHDPQDSTSLGDNNVITMILDEKGDIWAAFVDNGVDRLNPKTGTITHYHFDTPGFGEDDWAIALMESNDGSIWVGGQFTYEGMSYVAIIDPKTNTMRKLNLGNLAGPRMIVSMAQSSATGEVAIILNNLGVAFYYPDEDYFNFFSTENGFPFDDVAGVVCDKDGVFWMADNESSSFVRHGGFQNDFIFQELGSAPARWRSGLLGPNGHIYFPSWDDRWKEIDPSKIKSEISSSKGVANIVALFVLGEKQMPRPNSILPKPIWMLEEVSLPASAETIAFQFSDFDFQNAIPQFQYRLYPYEKEWKRTSSAPMANYYRIPAGEYTLEIKSINQMSFTDEQITTIKVIILPPWWRTWWAYGGYGLIFIGGVFVVDRIQRRRLLAKANAEAKEKELAQAREIEKAYTELKATQSQLIQSEKMASLGELTAGIAHEIQNPLNFINNFSEVNEELLNEMKEELRKGKIDDAVALANDAIENQKKIYHHGKRADAIVKGMLQHSRGGNDVKEPTDINELADEYLRLAYHGLRAKDKSFNATMSTDFDKSLEKISIVPQDIGRVILNLITNAFYAVSEKAKEESDKGYVPTVTVSTKGVGNNVEISVGDNGKGIPELMREKIFQPFFTTKPTGQGTGLGLSMSYDIVKSHGGTISVNSKEGLGSEFIITLIRL